MNTVFVYAIPGETYALVRGRRIGGWFRAHRVPALRSPTRNGYRIRSERVPDVMAALELDGIVVRFSRHMAPPHIPDMADDLEVSA